LRLPFSPPSAEGMTSSMLFASPTLRPRFQPWAWAVANRLRLFGGSKSFFRATPEGWKNGAGAILNCELRECGGQRPWARCAKQVLHPRFTMHNSAPWGEAIQNSKFQISDFRFQISGFRFQISGSRLQISHFTFPISDFQSHISNFRFPISNFKFRIAPGSRRDSP
jgi:hypothetical protein